MIESGYLGVENYGRARGHVEDSEEDEEEEKEHERRIQEKRNGEKKGAFDKNSTVTERNRKQHTRFSLISFPSDPVPATLLPFFYSPFVHECRVMYRVIYAIHKYIY